MPDSPETDQSSAPQDDPAHISCRHGCCRLSPKSSRERTGIFNHSEPQETAPIFASPRPYSTPDATLSSYHTQLPSLSMADSCSNRPDRNSSASLSTPFFTLPRVSSNAAFSGSAMSQPGFDSNTMIPSPFCLSSTESVPLSRSADRPGARSPEPASTISSSSSASSSSSISASSYTSNPTSQGSSSDPPDKYSSAMPSMTSHQPESFSSNNSQPHDMDSSSSLPRSISPFRAPQPPPHHQQLSRTLLSQPTAMRRYTPLPDTMSYPPPDPPVILSTENMSQSSFRTQAPYFPFLSHAPPPENSWIEVETLQNEYRLHVRLPGFTREGITLATKRRRILLVVADKWENGGGHFERRISFGYDADLVQVRADFDGLMLRIKVPRRISPISLHTTARSTPPAAVGRT